MIDNNEFISANVLYLLSGPTNFCVSRKTNNHCFYLTFIVGILRASFKHGAESRFSHSKNREPAPLVDAKSRFSRLIKAPRPQQNRDFHSQKSTSLFRQNRDFQTQNSEINVSLLARTPMSVEDDLFDVIFLQGLHHRLTNWESYH